jgi:hypothetical protein
MPDLEDEEPSSLADRLIRGENPPERNGLYLNDVIVQVRDFLFDLSLAGGRPFPCIRRNDGSLVPLAVSSFRWQPFQWERQYGPEIALTNPESARTLFRNGLSSFLGSRLRSLDSDHPRRLALQLPTFDFNGRFLRSAAVAGFNVDVSTSSSNLRVHASPTFRRSWRYFGSPSSPVYGVLSGGIYEFGVDGGSYSVITADPATFDIPYKTVSPVLSL